MIIVTHNPNLAVVCDAEQIVCASLDKAANYRMEYLSGSIENPTINKAIVDILEGTRPAFNNRDSKYEVPRSHHIRAMIVSVPIVQRENEHLRQIPVGNFPFTPSAYPGRRPRFSFLFTPTGIYRLQLRTLDRTLATQGLPRVGERYAILAYGSTACPGQLLEKKISNVPVIYGRLQGAEAVYAGRISSRGYVPATLARKKGSRPSWITLLTREQLKGMDKTEGRRDGIYALAELSDMQFTVGRLKFDPLYTYVNIRRGVMTIKNKPVSLRSMGQKRARSIISETSAEAAAERFLDFTTIPYPDAPARCSRILRR